MGDSRITVKNPKKQTRTRRGSRSRSRSDPRRARRSHLPKSTSNPCLTEYDQPSSRETEDKSRPFRDEYPREEEAIAYYSSRDQRANRSEKKQQMKREERSPRRRDRSQLRNRGSDPAVAPESTSLESSEMFECYWAPEQEMEEEWGPLRDDDAASEEVKKQYGAVRAVSKRSPKQLRKGGEGRHPTRSPRSGRRSQFRKTASDRSLKEVTPMEKLETLFSAGHNSTSTLMEMPSSCVLEPVKNEPPRVFASLNSLLSVDQSAEERRRNPSCDDASLDEDSTICSDMSGLDAGPHSK